MSEDEFDDDEDLIDDSDEEMFGERCISLLRSLLPGGVLPDECASIADDELLPEDRAADASTSSYSQAVNPFIITSADKILSDQVLEEDHLDEMASSMTSQQVRPRPQLPPKPAIDTVRYSMNNIKESADWQLDALLSELEELETQLNSSSGDQLLLGIQSLPTSSSQQSVHHSHQPSGSNQEMTRNESRLRSYAPPVAATAVLPPSRQTVVPMTSSCSSPDGDSAFGDTSSTESRNRNSAFSSNDSCRDSLHTPSPTQISPRVEEMTAEELKAAKIKQALEKMKEAKVTRIFVKFFVEDGAPLQMLVDERWNVAQTMQQLADKHQIELREDHCLVEEFPDLHIRRIYEDHENLVENIQMWQQDSPNKLLFVRRPDKYPFIDRPDLYLVTERTSDLEVPPADGWTRDVKQQFVRDFFSRDCVSPPEMEGFLYLKSDGRKSWKKHFFVLRPSGLYCAPKGKKTTSSKDLQCLMNLHSNQVYAGINWQKKYKAPTEHCISLKLTQLQIKNSQYIKYICAEDEATYRKWLVALRIAKNGAELFNNYEKACEGRRTAMNASASQNTSRVPSRVAAPQMDAISVNTMPGSSNSSQHDLRMNKAPSLPSPSQLSRVSQMTSSDRCISAAHSTVIEYDEQPTGTIKRAPLDALRRTSQSSGGPRSPSLGSPDDADSDEEFPAPPPVYLATRTETPTMQDNRSFPAPPPKPAYYATIVKPVPPTQAPPTPQMKKVPPPPPPRSTGTRVVSAVTTSNCPDLEAALAKRRDKMAQQV